MTASLERLSQQLATFFERQVQPGARLAVGYSGGLDSSVLLHLLAGLRASFPFSLTAVHVHHGLSPDADAWALHCTRVCAALDVPLETHRVEVRRAGDGLEAAARAARYRVYAQLDAEYVVLAQHRDDQAETVLLQLLRGASLKGLAAMPKMRPLRNDMALLRPFLDVTRAEIAACAAACGLVWVEDASNADLRLARNALRHEVMPVLSACFPDAAKALAQAAVHFAETVPLLDALAEADASAAISGAGLAVSVLHSLTEPRARNLLRYFLQQSGVEIRQDALQEALRQVLTARPDAQLRIEFGASTLRVYRQSVVIELNAQTGSPFTETIWSGENCLVLGEAGVLQFQATSGEGVRLIPGKVSVRQRIGGERLRPGPGRPRRTLKNLLREAGIPAWQRARLPMLYQDDVLIWAAGVGADSDFLVEAGQPGWLISWQAQPNRAG
jgi:tRNA(Ile)-lysidine synthase